MAPMSTNLSNQNLPKSFKKEGPHSSWMLVQSSIHIANNAFLEGIKCLKDNVNVDQFSIDLHFFFKPSAVRREDYKGVFKLTDVTMHYVIKHCQTCWLSLDKVLVRIIVQYKNLKV